MQMLHYMTPIIIKFLLNELPAVDRLHIQNSLDAAIRDEAKSIEAMAAMAACRLGACVAIKVRYK